MTQPTFPAALLALAIMLGPVACADNPTDVTDTSTTSAFTVHNGDRFVVSARPERIVLKKSVDGVEFPFDEASLQGKAILIHAIKSKADEGVYARVVAVGTEKGNYVVGAKPLSSTRWRRSKRTTSYASTSTRSGLRRGAPIPARRWPPRHFTRTESASPGGPRRVVARDRARPRVSRRAAVALDARAGRSAHG